MAFPKRTITGVVNTPSGDEVVAGRIMAILVPENAVVLDTVTPFPEHKVGGVGFSGEITASGIQSFALTALDSAVPLDAYYRVIFRVDSPVEDEWEEHWRVTGSGDLPVEEITPLE
jgi:hypothetical protein